MPSTSVAMPPETMLADAAPYDQPTLAATAWPELAGAYASARCGAEAAASQFAIKQAGFGARPRRRLRGDGAPVMPIEPPAALAIF